MSGKLRQKVLDDKPAMCRNFLCDFPVAKLELNLVSQERGGSEGRSPWKIGSSNDELCLAGQ